MATKVQRGGLDFEKFFRRRSSSIDRAKDPEKSIKTAKEDCETAGNEGKEASPSKFGKFFGQKCPEDNNDSAVDHKTVTKEVDEAGSQKTNELKKSSQKKKNGSSPECTSDKADDKREDSEACKELAIKDGVGQVKLAEIINNSIKEAVLNIVKEGVVPLADSRDVRAKDTGKQSPCCVGQGTQDKENKPGSPEYRSSLLSGANKTFDSHLCRSQYQQPSRSSSRSPCKLNNQHERVTVNQCTREVSPRVNKNRKVAKSTKQKERSVREGSPKICRPTKGQSSHFRTDNRRMTGNVNIYICSEANENAKDKQKSKTKKDCVDDSESAASSTLSVSTSKLVTALRKKQRKNLEDQSLSCLCEIPESSVKQYGCGSQIGEGSDDDSADVELPDTQSTSSKDACVYENTKYSDLDFPGSDLGSLDQPCTSAASDEYASYDRDDFWPCTSQDRVSSDDSCRSRRFSAVKQGDNSEKNLEERCSCCNVNSDSKTREPEQRKTRDKTCRPPRDTQQFNKCPCIVEEEDEDCCNNRKKSEEKLTVCGMPSTGREPGNAQNQNNEPGKSPSESGSSILKGKKERADYLKAEKKKSVRTSEIASTSSPKILDQKDKSNVEADIDSKPPKHTLLSTLRKNLKRSPDKESRESKITSPETSKEVGQVKNTETEENRKNSEASKGGHDNIPPVADEKQKHSFLFRSIKKAMDIVKIRKEDNVTAVEGGEKSSPDRQTKPQMNDDGGTNGEGNENDTCDRSCSENDKEKITHVLCNSSKQENRSRSRISTAIASRRSSASTIKKTSNVSICRSQTNMPDCPATKTEGSGQGLQGCKCEKPSERVECCCKKPEPAKDETCKCNTKCRKTKSGTSVCCKKLVTPRRESCACCPKCGNPVDKCICCSRKPEPIEPDPCKCCPRCIRPIPECKCCCSNQETMEQDFCKCCRRPKPVCCCDQEGNSSTNRSQLNKCQQPPDCQENCRQCSTCCSPKAECSCGQTFPSWECPKSMICIYCDKPQDNCTCKAPIRKCSQCGLPTDVCNCKPLPCCDCSGRQIVQMEANDGSTICVTAWKPRRSVRRYFARENNDVDGNSEEDCACYEKSKPYGSDRLPYQKGSVFSDVMSELQQKMSGSVCCNICRNVPCNCCCIGTEDKIERRPRQRLSTIAERRNLCQSQDRLRSKSPAPSCRCGTPRRKGGRKVPASKICDRCRTSPCRCRRSSASPQKKPPAKCYYCKSSPCICAPAAEPAYARPFRKADSSHRRRKECNSTEEYVNAGMKNENNEHRGRKSSQVVPCPRRQQRRKYCYRENPDGEHTLNPGERVR